MTTRPKLTLEQALALPPPGVKLEAWREQCLESSGIQVFEDEGALAQLQALLSFSYAERPTLNLHSSEELEALHGWIGDCQLHLIEWWLEALDDPRLELQVGLAALEHAWQRWQPVLEAAPAHDAAANARVVDALRAHVANANPETQKAVAIALTNKASWRRSPGPPYVGHWYATLDHLLTAVSTQPEHGYWEAKRTHLARSLSFATTGPNGLDAEWIAEAIDRALRQHGW